MSRSDDWDDGTVNHAASPAWNSGVRPDKEKSSMPSWTERTATGRRIRIGGTVGASAEHTPRGRFQLASPHSPDRAGRWHEVDEHEDGTITVEPKPDNSNSIVGCERSLRLPCPPPAPTGGLPLASAVMALATRRPGRHPSGPTGNPPASRPAEPTGRPGTINTTKGAGDGIAGSGPTGQGCAPAGS